MVLLHEHSLPPTLSLVIRSLFILIHSHNLYRLFVAHAFAMVLFRLISLFLGCDAHTTGGRCPFILIDIRNENKIAM